MTDTQARILSLMAKGREYTSGDIETLAKARGWYVGGLRSIGREMVKLQHKGFVAAEKLQHIAIYRRNA